MRALLWTGLTLAALWVVLLFVGFDWLHGPPGGPRFGVSAGGGAVEVSWWDETGATNFGLLPVSAGWTFQADWLPTIRILPRTPIVGFHGLALPLYIPAIVALSPWLIRRLRRPRFGPGQCGACGYDLAGLARSQAEGAPQCPECGARTPAVQIGKAGPPGAAIAETGKPPSGAGSAEPD